MLKPLFCQCVPATKDSSDGWECCGCVGIGGEGGIRWCKDALFVGVVGFVGVLVVVVVWGTMLCREGLDDGVVVVVRRS